MHGLRCITQWRQMVKPGELARIAAEAGLTQRKRKVVGRNLFWTLVLGFGSAPGRSIAALARFFGYISGASVSRQGLHERLTHANAAQFMKRCFERLSTRAAAWLKEPLPGRLSEFDDLTLIDSTSLRLVDRLAKLYPACRSNVRKAALKIHACMSLSQKQVETIQITGDRVSDRKAVRLGAWVRDRLLLFDLGYFDYGLFEQIRALGGDFCSRLKEYANGVIVTVRRGCPEKAIGKMLNGSAFFSEEAVDIDVCFTRNSQAITFRVVAIWDAESRDYHWYVTSISPDKFTAEEIAQIYRLRWQIELLFKEWKSTCRLKDLPSGDPMIVQCLIYAALSASMLSCMMLRIACDANRSSWNEMSPDIGVKILYAFSTLLGIAILRERASVFKRSIMRFLEALQAYAPLPNKRNAILDTTKWGFLN